MYIGYEKPEVTQSHPAQRSEIFWLSRWTTALATCCSINQKKKKTNHSKRLCRHERMYFSKDIKVGIIIMATMAIIICSSFVFDVSQWKPQCPLKLRSHFHSELLRFCCHGKLGQAFPVLWSLNTPCRVWHKHRQDYNYFKTIWIVAGECLCEAVKVVNLLHKM